MEPKLDLPAPIPSMGTKAFFDAAADGRLELQYCPRCDVFSLTGYKNCTGCLQATEWRASEGRATVSSWAAVYSCSHPGFASLTPYYIVEAKLTEGPVLSLRAISETGPPGMGDTVSIGFESTSPGGVTPVWHVQPARETG